MKNNYQGERATPIPLRHAKFGGGGKLSIAAAAVASAAAEAWCTSRESCVPFFRTSGSPHKMSKVTIRWSRSNAGAVVEG
jgi:hypothetical protein